MDYNLKFRHKGEKGYWYTTIKGDSVEEAIKEAEYFILKDKKIEKAILGEIVYKTKKIKEWNITNVVKEN